MKNKLKFDVVLTTGKSARTLNRRKAKAALKSSGLASFFGKIKNRQERKAMAKALKIPFTPKYNGKTFKLEHQEYKNKKGYTRYKSVLV